MLTKRAATILAILAMPWMLFVLIVNPGWMTLLVASPYAIFLVPSVWILVANRKRAAGPLPKVDAWLHVVFFASWLLFGLLFINVGDTRESVGSIVSHWLVNTFGFARQPLADASAFLSLVMLVVAWACVVTLLVRSRRRKNK